MSRISRHTIGSTEIVSIQDGETVFGSEVFPNADPSSIAGLEDLSNDEIFATSFNAFLVRSGETSILVDSGPRTLFGNTCGFLADAMSEAGTAPSEITHLLFTHMHPDHIAGSIGDDGSAVFENAGVFVTGAEHEFWTNDANFAGADESLMEWRGIAQSVFSAYKDRLNLVGKTAEIGGLLTLVDLPGHTPGHVGFRVDAGSECFLNITDVLHSQVLQFAEPRLGILFDADGDVARETRMRTLDMLATDRLPFSGGHILRPTIGYLERAGSGYRFLEA